MAKKISILDAIEARTFEFHGTTVRLAVFNGADPVNRIANLSQIHSVFCSRLVAYDQHTAKEGDQILNLSDCAFAGGVVYQTCASSKW